MVVVDLVTRSTILLMELLVVDQIICILEFSYNHIVKVDGGGKTTNSSCSKY